MQSKWPSSVSIKVNNSNFYFIENFTGFGKLRVSSDHEYYYSWNKNSIIFYKIAQPVRGHMHDMRKLLIKSLNLILYFIELELN